MNILAQKLAPYTVLLGSQSPRRAQLLQGLDIPFDVRVKNVDESFSPFLPVETVPQYLAEKKFDAFVS